MIYLYTKFHMPNANGSLVITVRCKVKENFCKAIMSLFYILLQKVDFTEIAYLLIIYYYKSL
jgi:hypothetical protein